MKTHGMTFRDDMAAALRNGTKTQTRRLIKPQPPQWADGREIRHIKDDLWGLFAVHGNAAACQSEDTIRCPWRAGDRIFAKEDHKLFGHKGENGTVKVQYRDGEVREVDCYPVFEFHGIGSHLPWTEARHMPKWAARTWVEITEIRAQRIREICEADCIAEGMPAVSLYSLDCDSIAPSRYMKKLWESLYPGSWERNEWVWALTFRPVKGKGGGE